MRNLIGKFFIVNLLAFTIFSETVRAESPRYEFSQGEEVVYEITVRVEYPSQIKTTIGYLVLWPKTVAAEQTTLHYKWGVKVFRTQTGDQIKNVSYGSLLPTFEAPKGDAGGRSIVIDGRGNVVQANVPMTESQLEAMQGSAWQLPLQPLPQEGQTSWTTQRPFIIYTEEKQSGGGWGGNQVRRVEKSAEEKIDYTADVQPDKIVVQRKYDLTTTEKIGDMPIDRLEGTGQYLFNRKNGRIESLEWKLVDVLRDENVTVKIPITTTARLVPPDEVATIRKDLETRESERNAALAKQQEAASKAERQSGKHIGLDQIPDGMETTDIMGSHKGGGPFAIIHPDRRPVLGFKIKVGSWGNRKCFNVFEPLYEKPEGKPEDGVTIVMARPGYAVGSITVNANEFVNALCITFMKITDTGVDPKQSYISPWFGQKIGTAQKRLGGTGKFVYGICGRKGLNYDVLGLIVEGEPADDKDRD